MPFDAFISYSSKDKIAADAACAVLEGAGVRCWIAPRDIRAGGEYGAAIVEAIDQCRVMVLIFSSSANDSTSDPSRNRTGRIQGCYDRPGAHRGDRADQVHGIFSRRDPLARCPDRAGRKAFPTACRNRQGDLAGRRFAPQRSGWSRAPGVCAGGRSSSAGERDGSNIGRNRWCDCRKAEANGLAHSDAWRRHRRCSSGWRRLVLPEPCSRPGGSAEPAATAAEASRSARAGNSAVHFR